MYIIYICCDEVVTQFINSLAGTTSSLIGINLWFTPQISEHCPKKIPGRLGLNTTWFIRPGIASDLTAKAGIVQEWITSEEVTISLVAVLEGKITELSVFNKRGKLSEELSL